MRMKIMRPRTWVGTGIVLLLLPWSGCALAGGFADTFGLVGGTVDVTNRQANSVWHPVAALVTFEGPTDTTLRVFRVSQGHTFLLSMRYVTNATHVVWVPEGEYPFAFGDVWRLTSIATNGVVQVIRKGG